MALKVRLHAVVVGTGLNGGFSKSVQSIALHTRVTGMLKHLPDRNIDIIAEGEKAVLEKFLTELRYGEGASRIREIKTTYSDATGEYRGFMVR